MDSLQGKILLASARLMDANFARSVILIVQHDENGALGLILNRPLETTLKQACEESLQIACAVDAPLHLGGPCEGPLMLLHQRDDAEQIRVIDDVFFTTDSAHIESLLLDADAKFKCFAGYAGWSAEQLENEIDAGAWVTVAADINQIFDGARGPQQWSLLMKRATLGQWIDPEKIPDDPNMN